MSISIKNFHNSHFSKNKKAEDFSSAFLNKIKIFLNKFL